MRVANPTPAAAAGFLAENDAAETTAEADDTQATQNRLDTVLL